MVSYWRYKNEPKYVLSSDVPLRVLLNPDRSCMGTTSQPFSTPWKIQVCLSLSCDPSLHSLRATSVEVGRHVIPTKQPAHWSTLTWWCRLTKPSQNARNIQVWNSYWFCTKKYSPHKCDQQMFPTTSLYCSQLFPLFLTTGFPSGNNHRVEWCYTSTTAPGWVHRFSLSTRLGAMGVETTRRYGRFRVQHIGTSPIFLYSWKSSWKLILNSTW